MKSRAKPIFIINVEGQLYRLTATSRGTVVECPTNPTITSSLLYALSHMTSWTDAEAAGRKRKSAPSGNGRTSKPKTTSGKGG